MTDRKKIISIIFIIFSIGIFAGALYFSDRSMPFSELIVDADGFNSIMSTRSESENDIINAVIFGEEKLFFDAQTDTFYYSLPEGMVGAYDPRVRVESDNGAAVSVLEDSITQDIIENNDTIELIAFNDDLYKLYHLKCTTLPLLGITTAYEGEITEDDMPVEIALFDNSSKALNRLVCSDANMHVRGGTTKAYPKLGYKVSLTQMSLGENERPNHVSLLGLREDDDWVLYPAYNDQEKIRNVFSANLWQYSCADDNRQHVNTGMEYRYIELFINNRYWGLYAIGYPIDEKQLEIDKNSYDTALYQKYMWDDESVLEFDGAAVDGYELKTIGDREAVYETLVKKWSLLIDYYKNLGINAKNNDVLYGGIDIDNAIDTYLFLNLIQGADNVSGSCIKNIYMALKKDRDKITALYCPWDMDISWGNLWSYDAPNYTLQYEAPADYNRVMESGYLNQLIVNQDPDVWDLILKKYRELRDTEWSDEYVNKLLDEYEADIYFSGAYMRDMERWQDGTYSSSKGLDTFRKYVIDRFNEMDAYYARIEALDKKSVYIVRSAQYKDFQDSTLIIELSDKTFLSDSNFRDLLEYTGVDIDKITNDVLFVVVHGKRDTVDYLPSSTDIVSYMKEQGESLSPDTADSFDASAFHFLVINDETSFELDMTQDYTFPKLSACTDLGSYLEDLADTGYNALFELKNHDILLDGKYLELFENLGINISELTDKTDFITVDGKNKKATVINDIDGSGCHAATVFGELSRFYNESGGYGVYLENSELYTILPQENETADIRISIIDMDELNTSKYINFSYSLQPQKEGYTLHTTGMQRRVSSE